MSKPTYQQTHTDVPLTQISIAYTPGAYIAEQVSPGVPVQKSSGKYYVYTKADFLRNEAAVRAPGTKAVRGGYGTSTANYTCVEYDFSQSIPDEIVQNADSVLRPLEDGTRFVTEKVLLGLEKDVASDIFGAGWSSSATPSPLWSSDTSDPLGDIETAVNGVVSTVGQEPNKGVIGRGLWRYLKNHPDVVDRIKYTAGPNSPAVVTLNAIAALGGLDAGRLFVGTAIEDTAADGATSTIAYVWGTHMFVGFVAPNPSLLTPSAAYTFNYQQRQIERFREDQEHADVIVCRQSWDHKVVAADCGYLIKSAA